LSVPSAEIFDWKPVCWLCSLVTGCFSMDIRLLMIDSTDSPEPMPAEERLAMMCPCDASLLLVSITAVAQQT
jgi:hypothetical protein